ncbi:MAG TPA: hypothetical protein PKD37_04625 [Oligoflexia bacterium]|nr:hypothetical protein [Oligoflexia bacterium]HMP27249.1 hypothetical protein [Oligoflexia bacterium]
MAVKIALDQGTRSKETSPNVSNNQVIEAPRALKLDLPDPYAGSTSVSQLKKLDLTPAGCFQAVVRSLTSPNSSPAAAVKQTQELQEFMREFCQLFKGKKSKQEELEEFLRSHNVSADVIQFLKDFNPDLPPDPHQLDKTYKQLLAIVRDGPNRDPDRDLALLIQLAKDDGLLKIKMGSMGYDGVKLTDEERKKVDFINQQISVAFSDLKLRFQGVLEKDPNPPKETLDKIFQEWQAEMSRSFIAETNLVLGKKIADAIVQELIQKAEGGRVDLIKQVQEELKLKSEKRLTEQKERKNLELSRDKLREEDVVNEAYRYITESHQLAYLSQYGVQINNHDLAKKAQQARFDLEEKRGEFLKRPEVQTVIKDLEKNSQDPDVKNLLRLYQNPRLEKDWGSKPTRSSEQLEVMAASLAGLSQGSNKDLPDALYDLKLHPLEIEAIKGIYKAKFNQSIEQLCANNPEALKRFQMLERGDRVGYLALRIAEEKDVLTVTALLKEESPEIIAEIEKKLSKKITEVCGAPEKSDVSAWIEAFRAGNFAVTDAIELKALSNLDNLPDNQKALRAGVLLERLMHSAKDGSLAEISAAFKERYNLSLEEVALATVKNGKFSPNASSELIKALFLGDPKKILIAEGMFHLGVLDGAEPNALALASWKAKASPKEVEELLKRAEEFVAKNPAPNDKIDGMTPLQARLAKNSRGNDALHAKFCLRILKEDVALERIVGYCKLRETKLKTREDIEQIVKKADENQKPLIEMCISSSVGEIKRLKKSMFFPFGEDSSYFITDPYTRADFYRAQHKYHRSWGVYNSYNKQKEYITQDLAKAEKAFDAALSALVDGKEDAFSQNMEVAQRQYQLVLHRTGELSKASKILLGDLNDNEKQFAENVKSIAETQELILKGAATAIITVCSGGIGGVLLGAGVTNGGDLALAYYDGSLTGERAWDIAKNTALDVGIGVGTLGLSKAFNALRAARGSAKYGKQGVRNADLKVWTETAQKAPNRAMTTLAKDVTTGEVIAQRAQQLANKLTKRAGELTTEVLEKEKAKAFGELRKLFPNVPKDALNEMWEAGLENVLKPGKFANKLYTPATQAWATKVAQVQVGGKLIVLEAGNAVSQLVMNNPLLHDVAKGMGFFVKRVFKDRALGGGSNWFKLAEKLSRKPKEDPQNPSPNDPSLTKSESLTNQTKVTEEKRETDPNQQSTKAKEEKKVELNTAQLAQVGTAALGIGTQIFSTILEKIKQPDEAGGGAAPTKPPAGPNPETPPNGQSGATTIPRGGTASNSQPTGAIPRDPTSSPKPALNQQQPNNPAPDFVPGSHSPKFAHNQQHDQRPKSRTPSFTQSESTIYEPKITGFDEYTTSFKRRSNTLGADIIFKNGFGGGGADGPGIFSGGNGAQGGFGGSVAGGAPTTTTSTTTTAKTSGDKPFAPSTAKDQPKVEEEFTVYKKPQPKEQRQELWYSTAVFLKEGTAFDMKNDSLMGVLMEGRNRLQAAVVMIEGWAQKNQLLLEEKNLLAESQQIVSQLRIAAQEIMSVNVLSLANARSITLTASEKLHEMATTLNLQSQDRVAFNITSQGLLEIVQKLSLSTFDQIELFHDKLNELIEANPELVQLAKFKENIAEELQEVISNLALISSAPEAETEEAETLLLSTRTETAARLSLISAELAASLDEAKNYSTHLEMEVLRLIAMLNDFSLAIRPGLPERAYLLLRAARDTKTVSEYNSLRTRYLSMLAEVYTLSRKGEKFDSPQEIIARISAAAPINENLNGNMVEIAPLTNGEIKFTQPLVEDNRLHLAAVKDLFSNFSKDAVKIRVDLAELRGQIEPKRAEPLFEIERRIKNACSYVALATNADSKYFTSAKQEVNEAANLLTNWSVQNKLNADQARRSQETSGNLEKILETLQTEEKIVQSLFADFDGDSRRSKENYQKKTRQKKRIEKDIAEYLRRQREEMIRFIAKMDRLKNKKAISLKNGKNYGVAEALIADNNQEDEDLLDANLKMDDDSRLALFYQLMMERSGASSSSRG